MHTERMPPNSSFPEGTHAAFQFAGNCGKTGLLDGRELQILLDPHERTPAEHGWVGESI